MIDYHIHTPLCNHAHGSMEDYIRHAIGKGLKEICFLDHLILAGPGMKHSMDIREIPFYMQAIARFKYRYRDSITIKAGLEVDFLPEKRDMIEEILGRHDFDAIGGSFHFVKGFNVASRKEKPPEREEDREALAEAYFEGLCRMLEWPYFDFICHPDIVKKTGITVPDRLAPLIDEVLARISAKNVALEFNTAGWEHPGRDSYPSESFVRKCFLKHIPFTLGSDAHSPENVGLHFDRAVSVLRASGYSEILSFEKRLARPVPLPDIRCPILS